MATHSGIPVLNPSLTNLDRSLRYYQKSHINPASWFSVVEQDYHLLLEALEWKNLFPARSTPYCVLDIGCGTGRFPDLLSTYLPESLHVHYDICDPSQFCLTTCRQALQAPLFPRKSWRTTLEHAEGTWAPGSYDVAWAIQSFYCLNHESLHDSLRRFIGAIHPTRGTACIFLGKRNSFRSQTHQLFSQQSPFSAPQPYVSAESVFTMLDQLGANTVIRELECVHTISIWEDRLLEQYLQQCVMDATPLPKWREIAKLRTFLDSFRHGDYYHFPNPCWLILSVPGSAGQEGKHRLQGYLRTVSPARFAS
ncbi:MAG: class I SAM-dependent methyltransferase [Nitrospirales bacterium]|nr:class I SAM-dependent methyltransferase [Nitrospirales bacterium]